MKWLITFLIWITLTWEAVPGAANYKIDASNNGRSWINLSFGPSTSTNIPLPDIPGRIDLRLIVIDEAGTARTSAIGWFYDPQLGSSYIANFGGSIKEQP